MLNTPISWRPASTMRRPPAGKSSTGPTSIRSGMHAAGSQPQEPLRVLAEDLPSRLGGERQLEHGRRVVEVVMGPVGGEHDLVLAVEQIHDRDYVVRRRRLLDRLGAVEA